ncbi:MAG: hypothetical protein KDC75_09890 [Phaeodactylibacter sp.]|nr:hypothetical protein [Phaeodactylibacter sp.]
MAIRKQAGNWMLAIVALSIALSAYGQDCGKDCQCILDNARRAAEQEQPDFQRALSLFNAAKLCFPDSVDIVQLIDGEVVDMFERINRLKEQADQAKIQAKLEETKAKKARDLAQSLRKSAETERQKALDAQDEAEKANVRLVVEEKKAQQQYRLAEARRLDIIAKELAADKRHTEAWIVGLHKWRELGDSLGGPLDSLAAGMFGGSEKILLRNSLYSIRDTATVSGIEPGAQRRLLVHYRDDRVELQTLTGEVLHTFRMEGLKETLFSPDGSRVGMFSGNRAEVYTWQNENGQANVQLERGYDLENNEIDQLVFAPNNEAFIVTDTVFFSMNRPNELAYTYSNRKIHSLQPFPVANFQVGTRQGYAFLYQYQLTDTGGVFRPQRYKRLLVVTPPSTRDIRKVKVTSFDSDDIHIAPSGRFIIGQSARDRVKYMDENGRLLAYFKGKSGRLEVTPHSTESGFYILTYDTTHLWAWTRKGANIARMDEAAANLRGLNFSPDNAYLFTYSNTEGKLWGATGTLQSQTGNLSELGEIRKVVFSNDGKLLVILHGNFVVSSWEIFSRPMDLSEWAQQHHAILPTEQEKTEYESQAN